MLLSSVQHAHTTQQTCKTQLKGSPHILELYHNVKASHDRHTEQHLQNVKLYGTKKAPLEDLSHSEHSIFILLENPLVYPDRSRQATSLDLYSTPV